MDNLLDMGNVLTEIWKKKRKKERKKETKDILEPQRTHCQVDICCFFTRQTMNKLPTNELGFGFVKWSTETIYKSSK